MRLWCIHPKYLDSRGLVALWREGLLAQKVLEGKTKGYRHHPQLIRFKNNKDPLGAIGAYLSIVAQEAARRGYRFNTERIVRVNPSTVLICEIGLGQLEYEFHHLKLKLGIRDRRKLTEVESVRRIEPHPAFRVVAGNIEEWERA